MSELPYLNLGCGSSFSTSWTNIDFVSGSPHVKAHNLLKGIPFPDQSFELVYHSHVLEHFPKNAAPEFIAECYRVLKPGGVIRIAIPDLEQIALNYVRYLNEAAEGQTGADQKYEWTLLEMYDQVVREYSGGEMAKYIKDVSKNNDDFLLERNGKEAEGLINSLRAVQMPSVHRNSFIRSVLSKIYHFSLRRSLEGYVLGENRETYKSAIFRKQGEIHQWMYDRYSLSRMLKNSGFRDPVKQDAFTSYIKNWSDFKLDGDNGMVRKPDSLFMEAVK
ncbi:MAG: class I SAM-dependent methyltransferase [Bacteroidia bacterium]